MHIKAQNEQKEVKKMLDNIEAERVRHRLTKEQLSSVLGVTTKTYYNWVNEETDIPGIALIRLSRLFNVDVGYLMQGCSGVESEKEVG